MKSVMIVGVGGQGTLLASRVLGRVMLDAGYDVKVSEVHGMSQRGGSVVTYVRWGERVESPVINEGEADILLAFEQLDTQKIDPMPVITGAADYPAGLLEKIGAAGARLTAVDALRLAEEAGSQKAVNVVLIGAMASSLDIPEESWLAAIEKTVPAKFLEMNKRAFALGYRA
ncbi:MAG: indolepyruvate oxidoreductase subunit beta [Clostridiales bacterium]|nr:indolepyruvate oxidoreductase subunit beta [Clostridiales bacterium]